MNAVCMCVLTFCASFFLVFVQSDVKFEKHEVIGPNLTSFDSEILEHLTTLHVEVNDDIKSGFSIQMVRDFMRHLHG